MCFIDFNNAHIKSKLRYGIRTSVEFLKLIHTWAHTFILCDCERVCVTVTVRVVADEGLGWFGLDVRSRYSVSFLGAVTVTVSAP